MFAGIGRYINIGMFVSCDKLPGASSSPIVTKLCEPYPWPVATGDEVITFRKVEVGGGGMRSAECPSSYFFFVVMIVYYISLKPYHI